MVFAATALLCLLGGLLYLPCNPDATSYRTPRVLQWLAEQRWHWIHASDTRLNIGATGFEWLSAPIISLTRTDHFVFLINWLAYMQVPALIFYLFILLQVRPRVAWWWMWILSSGWCYATQAASAGNDSFSTPYALAAVVFALFARESHKVSDVWISWLAAALLTGAKQTNTPLVALWLIAVWPSLRLLTTRPWASLGVLALGLGASGGPIAWFNLRHLGSWTGIDPSRAFELHSPFWGIIGNAFALSAQNLMPPILPFAHEWNNAMEHFRQTPFGVHFKGFEDFGRLGRAAAETTAGLGLSVCVITLLSVCLAHRWRRPARSPVPDRQFWLLRLAPFALLLVFMAKDGVWQNARQLAAYYPFLFPLLLARPGHERVVENPWWRTLALLVMLTAPVLVFFSRQRPLWPACQWTQEFRKHYPRWDFLAQVQDSYSARPESLNDLRAFASLIPKDEPLIGYATHIGFAEVELSRPFGSRRVIRMVPGDPVSGAAAAKINFIVAEDLGLAELNFTVADVLSYFKGQIVAQADVLVAPEVYKERLYLVRLRHE